MSRSLAVALVVAACGPAATPAPEHPGSRGLRASEHLELAHQHEQRAAELARWPERRRSDLGAHDDPSIGLWYRGWVPEEELRSAAVHRSEAAALQAAYHDACEGMAADTIAISPLQRHGLGGIPTPEGVTLLLAAEAGPPDRLLAEMRCHRAWMMLSGTGMDACPLDLAGIRIEAYGDTTGITVEISIDDDKLVPELQRRASADLEAAARMRAMPASR
jgi:hypothetical protein